MRKIRTALAAMLVMSAFAASVSDADAQARRAESNSRSVTRTTPKTSKSSARTISGKSSSRPSGAEVRKPSQPSVRVAPQRQVSKDNKPSTTVARPVAARPSRFWSGHDHCFGHRVRVLPSHARRHVHYGITYYCFNDVWYRPFGGYYVVCRPPFGTVLAAELIADMAWAAVRLSYYHTVANTYSRINDNNEYIAQQNETIAMNAQLASAAYSLADELGLVQSYADAGSSYFYQDGVFYTMGADGQYRVIVPPAGALVESLPDDYDLVTLNGDEYYKVDDTVYRVAISEGKPYFEVLGQLYS